MPRGGGALPPEVSFDDYVVDENVVENEGDEIGVQHGVLREILPTEEKG
jgi:hypothetical protein